MREGQHRAPYNWMRRDKSIPVLDFMWTMKYCYYTPPPKGQYEILVRPYDDQHFFGVLWPLPER